MSEIEIVEAWLVAQCEEVLACYFGAGLVDVDTAPAEWDGAYVRKYLRHVPAVRIVYGGGRASDETDVLLNVSWSILVVTGWQGTDFRSRRIGTQGAYRIAALLARWLHNRSPPQGESDSGLMRLHTWVNLDDFTFERVNLTVQELSFEQDVPIEAVQPPGKELDDFLRATIDWRLADADESLVTDEVEIRNAET